jgi:hypothetical protein
MSHVPALRHVKNPSGILVNSDPPAKLGGGGVVPAFAGRVLAHLGDAWGLWR